MTYQFIDKLLLNRPHPSPLPEGEGISSFDTLWWSEYSCGSVDRLLRIVEFKPPLNLRQRIGIAVFLRQQRVCPAIFSEIFRDRIETDASSKMVRQVP